MVTVFEILKMFLISLRNFKGSLTWWSPGNHRIISFSDEMIQIKMLNIQMVVEFMLKMLELLEFTLYPSIEWISPKT